MMDSDTLCTDNLLESMDNTAYLDYMFHIGVVIMKKIQEIKAKSVKNEGCEH